MERAEGNEKKPCGRKKRKKTKKQKIVCVFASHRSFALLSFLSAIDPRVLLALFFDKFIKPVESVPPVISLDRAYKSCIYICIDGASGEFVMRTTLNVDDELVAKASELTGVQERTSLVRMGLEALIAQKSAQRLGRLGGTEKQLRRPRRRRTISSRNASRG
jgi:Arc/MetJ family transcription regulator